VTLDSFKSVFRELDLSGEAWAEISLYISPKIRLKVELEGLPYDWLCGYQIKQLPGFVMETK
jgi:hypothetical protein